MKPKPAIVVYFVISLILSLPLLFFFFFFCFKTNTYTPPDESPISDLRIRPRDTPLTETYIQRQEVEALRRVGVSDSVGMDLVPYPPLVVKGDFHHQPFDDGTFDFEFSNVFDHALFPDKFVGEIERTLKPGGICVLHVALSRRADKYSANDLFSVKPLVNLFTNSKVVHVRKVDGFGLDTEVVFRKTAKKKIKR
ncbi:hypothetical protein OIU84_018529 [Salix udensis]|uniref:Methyltransferase type 11 domain-containing protein n=1 Tax=Salix udensis TaxID=889485 RepID=A0AAD6KYJ6_9ROSI|nr:hypothetical protein OIU84_018529 [Salix udensis]